MPVRAVSAVRNGDNGGGNATAVEPSLESKALKLLYLAIIRIPKRFKCDYNPTPLLSGVHRLSRRFERKCTRAPSIEVLGSRARRTVAGVPQLPHLRNTRCARAVPWIDIHEIKT